MNEPAAMNGRGRWKCSTAILAGAFFLGLAAFSNPAGLDDPKPFTLIVLPDTQHYSRAYPELFLKQTSWVKENVAKENIVFVTQVGDIVDGYGTKKQQWEVANQSMSALDNIVPWGVALGNHDLDQQGNIKAGASVFLKHFGPERFKKYSWFAARSDNGLNTCQVFEGGGEKFLIVHLELGIPEPAMRWAEGILKQFPRHRAIVSTHIYLKDGDKGREKRAKEYVKDAGGHSGEEIWQKFIKKNDAIFLVVCGHWYNTGNAGGEWSQVSTNEAGHRVLEVLANYQGRENGGNGRLRIMRFDPAKEQIQVKTYSPSRNEFEADKDSQFVLPLAYKERLRN